MSDINELLNKLKRVDEEIEREKGPLRFFALVQRDESLPDRWDIVISASWFGPDTKADLDYVVSKMYKYLLPEELVTVSRVVLLDPSEPFIQEAAEMLEADWRLFKEIRNRNISGLDIRQAYIIHIKELVK